MKNRIRLGTAFLGLAFTGCQGPDVESVPAGVDCDTNYAAIKAAEMIKIETGLAIYKRFITEKQSEEDLSEEEIQTMDQMQVILDSRSRPVDRQDLTILDSADMRLSDSSMWDRADDRKCEPQDQTFSLFCALYFGSIDTIGEYQHRRTALQEIRFTIEDATGGREFVHRMMDFNNLSETSFDDVKTIIKTARARVQNRLDLQLSCTL